MSLLPHLLPERSARRLSAPPDQDDPVGLFFASCEYEPPAADVCERSEIQEQPATVLIDEWKHPGGVRMHGTLTAKEAAEERRLWADYYEALERLLELMRREGTGETAISRIVDGDIAARRAIARIKQLRGIR